QRRATEPDRGSPGAARVVRRRLSPPGGGHQRAGGGRERLPRAVPQSVVHNPGRDAGRTADQPGQCRAAAPPRPNTGDLRGVAVGRELSDYNGGSVRTKGTLAFIALAVLPCACSRGLSAADAGGIEHVVILLQENHSFDNYFGVYCTGTTAF